jgi:hypothetical protein
MEIRRRRWVTIDTLLEACDFVLDNQGEPQSSFWLASQATETKFWRATATRRRGTS